MGDLNVDALRQGLTEYLEVLNGHISAIEGRAEAANSSFIKLMSEQAGSAADEYRSKWEPAMAWLQEYVDGTRRLAHLLEERLSELEKVR